jgi:hypothetical protein
MNRRQMFGLAGGAAASAVVMGATAPPAQAFAFLIWRALMGTAVREAIRDTVAGEREKKAKALKAKKGKLRPLGRRKKQRQRQS